MRIVRVLSLVVAAALLGSPGELVAQERPIVRDLELSRDAADAYDRAIEDVEAAERALKTRQWDVAIAAQERAIAVLRDQPALGGLLDQSLYNVACAHARAGHVEKAVQAFAESIRNGLRPPIYRESSTGRFRVAPVGLTLEHLLADADLDPIRNDPVYAAALVPYLAAGEAAIEAVGDASKKLPALLVLAEEGTDADKALPVWRDAAKGRDVVLALLAGPVRPTPDARRWLLREGDERWAVAKVRGVIEKLAKDPRVDASRIYVVGVGERPGEAAWASALDGPARIAGFAAPGARFHPEWHADAIASAPKTWRVALAERDDRAAAMLKDRGIESARVDTAVDAAPTLASAVIAALLGKP